MKERAFENLCCHLLRGPHCKMMNQEQLALFVEHAGIALHNLPLMLQNNEPMHYQLLSDIDKLDPKFFPEQWGTLVTNFMVDLNQTLPAINPNLRQKDIDFNQYLYKQKEKTPLVISQLNKFCSLVFKGEQGDKCREYFISNKQILSIIGEHISLRGLANRYLNATEVILKFQEKSCGHNHLQNHLETQYRYLKSLQRFAFFTEYRLFKLPLLSINTTYAIYQNYGVFPQHAFHRDLSITDLALNQLGFHKSSTVECIIDQAFCIEKRLDEHREDIDYIKQHLPSIFEQEDILKTFMDIDKYLVSLKAFIGREENFHGIQIRELTLTTCDQH